MHANEGVDGVGSGESGRGEERVSVRLLIRVFVFRSEEEGESQWKRWRRQARRWRTSWRRRGNNEEKEGKRGGGGCRSHFLSSEADTIRCTHNTIWHR